MLANHGTVSYGESVERAYWWTEILDAYCRMLLLSPSQLGHASVTCTRRQGASELLALKQQVGLWQDPRLTQRVRELRRVRERHLSRAVGKRPGVERKAFDPPPPMKPDTSATTPTAPATAGANIDALVQVITDRVLEALAERA
jgi:L-fuculose-phosphate aldolase